MEPVKEIIEALGGVNGTCEKTGFPQQTVSSWICRTPPEIPPWRRPVIAELAKSPDIELSDGARAYLASNRRTPKLEQAA